MTWVTVSCTVWADAPGYKALIVICGGAIGGYWETGSVLIDRRPASMIMMAITQAKIGRLIKKRGIEGSPLFLGCSWLRSTSGRRCRLYTKGNSLDRTSRSCPLHPIQDNTVPCF